MDSGVSGIQNFQERMDVIGNNIANVNTVGYKSARTELADQFSQTLSAPGQDQTTAQVGLGVTTVGIFNQFTQGALSTTGVPTDVGIVGDGFFVVRNPLDGEQFVTRAGDFRLDNDGYLVSPTGLRVQGFSDSGLSARGDIQIDGTGRPATADPLATVVGFNIGNDGRVLVQLSDGTQYARGQILLQRFTNPQALVKQGQNLYSNIGGGGPLANPEAPGTNGLGQVQAGTLELSNVDLTNEFANMITTQRAFQASAKIITTSDEMLQDVINIKR
jgi:flagellar hook protein FlgE